MIVTRFAPSPTGPLHLGHAAAALFARQHAQSGHFLLRIEDIDPLRCRPEFTTAIQSDLAWLGLIWHGPVRLQSSHLPDYAATLTHLQHENLVYPCFCTRAAIQREIAVAGHAPHTAPDGSTLYPGTCRHLPPSHRTARIAAGEPHAVRLDMAAAIHRTGPLTWQEAGQGPQPCTPEAFGDIVLARKDVPTSYHLCVTHDDALQGVTLVTRAIDLAPATSIHRVLQTLMGWPEPTYAHHPLLKDPAGHRLSKRNAAPAISAFRSQGATPETVLAMARSALASA